MREFLLTPPFWAQLMSAGILLIVGGVAYGAVPIESVIAGQFTYRDAFLIAISLVSFMFSGLVVVVGIACRVGFMFLKYRLDNTTQDIKKVRHRVDGIDAHNIDMASKWARLDADVENLQLVVFREVRTQ